MYRKFKEMDDIDKRINENELMHNSGNRQTEKNNEKQKK